jgi:hypothetical protein
MCDRALPGERLLGRVSRKKSSYAEVKCHSLMLSVFVISYVLFLADNSEQLIILKAHSICGT